MRGLLCWIGLLRHDPRRELIGGFRCRACGKPGDDMTDFGFDGYVRPVRKVYERGTGGRGTVTRTEAWERGRRGW